MNSLISSEKDPLFSRLGIISKKQLDGKDYVWLCTGKNGDRFVFKTDNLYREVEWYRLFHSEYERQCGQGGISVLKLPNLCGFWLDQWVVFEYIDGYNLRFEKEFLGINITESTYFLKIIELFWEVKRILFATRDVWPTEDGMLTLSDWYEGMIKRSISSMAIAPQKMMIVKEKIDTSVTAVKLWSERNSDYSQLEPTFGVFGQYQIIASKDGAFLYLTDFGDHIRKRCPYHDIAWLMKWDILRFSESEIEDKESGVRYVEKMKDSFYELSPKEHLLPRDVYSALFYINTLEMLVRCIENLVHAERNHLQYGSEDYREKLFGAIDFLFESVLQKLQQH